MSGESHDFPSLKPGGHVCLPYTTAEEKDRAIGGFLRDGLVRGERCLYMGSPSGFASVEADLELREVPVSSLRARGSLLFADGLASSGPDVDLEVRASAVRSAIASAKADGYSGLRVAGDSDGRLLGDRKQLAGFESALSSMLEESRCTCLCAFDQRSADPLALEVALSAHDTAILSGRLCPNPFFHAPGDPGGTERSSDRAAWMTASILELARARELLEAENAALIVQSSRAERRTSALRNRVAGLSRAVESRDRLLVATARWLARPLPGMCSRLREFVRDERFVHVRDVLESCTEHLSAVTRLSAGLDEVASFLHLQVVLRPEPLDIVEIARGVASELVPTQPTDAPLVRVEGADRITGTWDRLRVTRLFHTLITTAREQGPESKVRLQLDDHGLIVRIRLEFSLPHLPGISESGEHPHPNAAGTAGESDYERLAVRLWPAREIVRVMGGTLGISTWADSRVMFTLDLPKSMAPPSPDIDSVS